MNRVFNNLLISLLSIILLAISIDATSLIPLGIEPFDFIYNSIEKDEAINQNEYHYEIAPYIISSDKIVHIPLPFLFNIPEKKLNLFILANQTIISQTLQSPEALETIRAGISAQLHNNVFLFSNIILDENKAEDKSYTGKKWHGLAGGVEQSFVHARFKYGNVSVGRFKSFWGIKKSLLLSESNALDGLQYTLTYKKLSLTYRIAKLNQLETNLTTSVFENRYFAGHRLDLRLHKKLRVGLFESIIFGGTGRTLEFNYLNPLMSYHAEQLNNNVNDNSFLGFDFTYYPFKKTKLYGQLLIDDFQIENSSQGDQEPNQYGVMIGGYFVDIMPSYDIRLEYTKITNRTYNQAFARNRYTFENNSLGYFNNNDFDNTNLTLTKWISQNSLVSIKYSYYRNGEGTINDIWSEPWLDTDNSYNESFPFGIVEKTNKISGQYKGFLFKNFYIDALAGFENITNRDNIEQNSIQNKFIKISLYTYISGRK